MLNWVSLGGLMLRLLLLLPLLLACASTSRTKYAPYKKKQGYTDGASVGNIRVVSFKANAYTKTAEAELFAKFRAIEVCKSSGSKLAHILAVLDKTVSKDVIRTTSSGFPSYYYGMSPYYS